MRLCFLSLFMRVSLNGSCEYAVNLFHASMSQFVPMRVCSSQCHASMYRSCTMRVWLFLDHASMTNFLCEYVKYIFHASIVLNVFYASIILELFMRVCIGLFLCEYDLSVLCEYAFSWDMWVWYIWFNMRVCALFMRVCLSTCCHASIVKF